MTPGLHYQPKLYCELLEEEKNPSQAVIGNSECILETFPVWVLQYLFQKDFLNKKSNKPLWLLFIICTANAPSKPFNLLNASSYELPFFKAHQKTIHNCRSSGHKNGCSSRVDKNPLMMPFCCNFPRIKIVPVMTRKSKWLTSSFLVLLHYRIL